MPRPPRASVGNQCYHVLNRGNARRQVFFKDRDYDAFLKAIGHACVELPLRLLAWCLLPNHFHLVVWTHDDGDLSRWMHWLQNTHVRRYHQLYHSSGHLWQGRFKAFPIQHDDHLLPVLRYVERHPLRAGLVDPEKDPEKGTGTFISSTALLLSRSYRLVCVPDEEVPIRAEWVQFWTEEAPLERVVLSVDPAVSQASSADRSALVVLGRTRTNEVRVLEAVARRVPTPELVHLIDDLDRRWHPEVILFESNAAFAGVRDLLVRHTRFGPKIQGVTQTRDKMSRAHALSVPVQNGAFRLQGRNASHVHTGQQELFDEMTTFPFGAHDDLLDAAATGAAYLLDRPEPRVW